MKIQIDLIMVGLFFGCFLISIITFYISSHYANKILAQFEMKKGIFEFNYGRKNWKNTLQLVDQYRRNVLVNITNEDDFDNFILFRKISIWCRVSALMVFILLLFR